MKVTYIDHSGFAVELSRCVLIFDYYIGELPKWDKDKKIYVFVSHKHRDHFNLNIFSLADKYEDVHFFLGSDVKLSDQYLERNHISLDVKEKITNIGKNKRMTFDQIEILTLRSTDTGVAFVVRAENKTVYHAGDLNWWHWEGEPSPFNENMAVNYKNEIDCIKEMHLDAAFVPLDPRLEDAYRLGMDYFLENVSAAKVFPMHMWEKYDYISKYKQTENGLRYSEKIVEITGPGQEFDLWNI